MNLSRNIRHTVLYTLAVALGKGTALLLLPVITYHLSLSDYGRLELLVAVADVGSVLLGFGLVDALYRFTSGQHNDDAANQREYAATFLGLSLLLGAAGLVLGQILAPVLAYFVPGLLENDLRILLATIALTSCIHLPLTWLRIQQRVLHYCLLFGGKAVVQAVLVWLALRHGYGVTGILLAGLCTDVVLCLILSMTQVRRTGIRLPLQNVKRILPYSMPLVLGGIACCLLGSFDRFFLFPVVDAPALAHYSLAGKFALIVALMSEPFNLWWFPKRFSLLSTEQDRRRNASFVMAGVLYITSAATMLSVVAPMLIIHLTPVAYHPATYWVPFLSGIAALHAITNLMNVGIYAQRTGWIPTAINVGAACIAFVGYITLIPLLGVAGAIIATYIALIFRFLLSYHLSQRFIHLPYCYGVKQIFVHGYGLLRSLRRQKSPSVM